MTYADSAWEADVAGGAMAGLQARHKALLERVTVLEKALEEIAKQVDGFEQGLPFGTEDMSLPLVPYLGDVARKALDA